MRTLLIDDSGTLTDSASSAFRADLSALGTGSDFTDYCIRNLGFVAVASNAASAHVRLRPNVVSPIAFAGLMYWLGENMGKRVMLSVLDGEWSHRMIANTRDALADVAILVQRAQLDRQTDYLSRTHDITTLRDSNPLKALVRMHAQLSAAYALEQIGTVKHAAEEYLDGRYMITTADGNLKNIVMSHVGDGHSQEANYWLKRGIGSRLNDFADTEYGRWTANAHFEAARLGQPRLDQMDLVINWPAQGRKRYTFQRLLLPLQKNADGHALLCATLSDSSIDLRSQAG